jgi:diguanylate cyclase
LEMQEYMSEVAPTPDQDTLVPDVARRALESMTKWNVPWAPENYHVWFNHSAGRDDDLSQAIKDIIDAGRPFSADVNATLYRNHISGSDDSSLVEQTLQETQALIRNLMEYVTTGGDSAGCFSENLTEFAEKLGASSDAGDADCLVKGLIDEAGKMAQASKQMQVRMEETSGQAESLRQRLHEAEAEAAQDSLTGLFNRKGADSRLAELQTIFQEQQISFSVMMIDIDHFKQFNDTYGHQVGDAVLRIVAKTLKDSVKGKDFVARYGGEEFMVLLPDTGGDGAVSVANEILGAVRVRRLTITSTQEKISAITASIGVAQFAPDDTVATVVERADKALYLAKNSGRDNVKHEADL